MRRTLIALALLCSASAFAADGGALYKTKCAPCHAADGTGNTPVGKSLKVKSLASAEVQKLSDDELLKVIQSGKGKMPAFAGKLSDDDIKDVVQFIRTFATK
ncbi:MAG TPA: cytochrome c [Thermoanaerobaculia bacterium]